MHALLVASVSTAPLACGGESSTTPSSGAISTITLSPQTLTLGVGSSVALDVSVRDADGQPTNPRTIFWSSSDAAIARVSAAGLVTALAPGSVQISATVEGKSAVANVAVAPTSVASVQLSSVELRLTTGQRVQLTASARDASGAPLSGRVVTWTVSDASIAVVDSTGALTALAPGGTTVTAASEGRTATAAVFVTSVPVATVVLTPSSTSIVEGQTTQLRVETRSSTGVVLSGRTIAWSSSNASVASVSSSGLVTGVATGTTTITASSEGRSGSASVTITARPVNAIVVSPSQLSLIAGQAVALTVQITDAQGNLLSGRPVTYRSDSVGVASVSANGAVTAVAPGSATITVTSEGRSATVRVVVSAVPISSIRVTPSLATLTVGDDTALTAVTLDGSGAALSGRVIAWSSGSPSVATVSTSGLVTAVGVGSVIILAQAEGRTGSATITVNAPPIAVVTVAPSTVSVDVGGTVDLAATVNDATGATVFGRVVLWSSSVPSVATVSSTGRVSAVAAGTSTVTATVDGKSGTAQITVTPTPIGTVTVAPASRTLDVGGTVDLVATVLDVNGVAVSGRTVTWSSSAIAVAAVSSTGRVTALVPGTATITATVDGKSGTAQILVSTPAVQTVGRVTVSPASATIKSTGPSDRTVQLNAVVYADSASGGSALTNAIVVWSSNAPLIATVSVTGLVTAISEGTAIISATSGTKSGTSTITVVKR
ncbi:Ig-like domain-containing protein [Gemmatimonas sp.]|uniref:Ig-like domain-containing protein n=1 Tax=Gemmatimonas sp. TaxID=1962908 RepID=UPI00286DB9B1|nr:Ig-like domain-containing protein [Gemmatimonas sp.]